MNTQILFVASCVLLLLGPFFPEVNGSPSSYFDDDQLALEDYSENDLERILQIPQKRACIRRGGNCDHRPTDCCYNSSCRCNLWGANCRCQRKGLFQKWGK